MCIYDMPFEERVKLRQQIEARYILICGIVEKSEPTPIKIKGKRGRGINGLKGEILLNA